jgi:hypothetical protein
MRTWLHGASASPGPYSWIPPDPEKNRPTARKKALLWVQGAGGGRPDQGGRSAFGEPPIQHPLRASPHWASVAVRGLENPDPPQGHALRARFRCSHSRLGARELRARVRIRTGRAALPEYPLRLRVSACGRRLLFWCLDWHRSHSRHPAPKLARSKAIDRKAR